MPRLRFQVLAAAAQIALFVRPALAAAPRHHPARKAPTARKALDRAAEKLVPLLFPGWTEQSQEVTGPDGAPLRVRPRASLRWTTDGRPLVALLIDEGSGPKRTTHLALFDLAGPTPSLIPGAKNAWPPDTVPSSGRVSFEPVPIAVDRNENLLGLRVARVVDGRPLEVLQLYRLDQGQLDLVFERPVRSAARADAPICTATVTPDAFGTAPFPLKVTERCLATGRTSTEMWRWEKDRYLLHGPASDAARAQDDFESRAE